MCSHFYSNHKVDFQRTTFLFVLIDLTFFFSQVTKGMIFQARMSWRANPPPDMPEHIKAQLEAQFALGISLYHAWSLLNNHGLKSFHNYCSDFQAREREQKVSLAHRELVRTQEWQDLMNLLNQVFFCFKSTLKINACLFLFCFHSIID